MYSFAYGLGGFFGALVAGKTYGENLFLYSAIFALFVLITICFLPKIAFSKYKFRSTYFFNI